MTAGPIAPQPRRPGWRRVCPCPHAVAAALIFALWPAGVAMSSVVGTDMPAAALLALALALLVTLGPRRPYAAAIAFGLALGLAAWIRAVALPLSALAFLYWLAVRQKLHRAALLTAAGVGATLIVLLPWGIRHVRQSGALYFTDDHGGITALIGANPNSEGTYTRALNRMFKDVTGKSVLDEPHRETDRAAYAMAREWFRFEPGYALGLAALKADRLFDPEHRLLYWSILRPGVLVGRPAAWFAARRDAIVRFADAFGLTIAGLALAGVAAAARAPALAAARPRSVSARVCRDLRDLLRGTTLPPADRAPGASVRRAGAGRDRRRRARGGGTVAPRASCTRRRRSAPALVRRRRLALRLAGAARRRNGAAGAPPLGGVRGRRRRRAPLAAVGAGAAARGAVAAGGIARGRARAGRRRRATHGAARASGRRSAAGREVRASLSAGVGVRRRAPVARGKDGGGRCGKSRDIRRRNRPPGWTVGARRRN